jgi:hypothetical protein
MYSVACGIIAETSFPRSWNKGVYQRPARPLSAAVLYHNGEVRRFPVVPKLEVDHVLFSFGIEGFAELAGVRGRGFSLPNYAVPYPAALVGGIGGDADYINDFYAKFVSSRKTGFCFLWFLGPIRVESAKGRVGSG